MPWTKEERRASTSASYRGIWRKHLHDRVGEIRLREFRTVDASRTLRAIAKENSLTRRTLRSIKSVLSTIFTYAKNEGAFDGANPVEGALIPNSTREAGETHAYDHDQVVQILEILPLLAKRLVATAAFAGLRKGKLRGLEWNDCTSNKLTIKRSIWGSVISPPKTRAGRASVPAVRHLAAILNEYRAFMGNPEAGAVFHSGDGLPINLDNLVRTVIRPALERVDLPWYGWHALRRGFASTLYAMGAQDKVVQRILRHARPHVTKECYDAIANMKADGKTFEPVTYDGAGHGFMRSGEAPDAKDADKKVRGEAWERWKNIMGKDLAANSNTVGHAPRKGLAIRRLNRNYNRDLKNIFRGAATWRQPTVGLLYLGDGLVNRFPRPFWLCDVQNSEVRTEPVGLMTQISTAPDGKALAAVSPVAHARSSFPGPPGVASLGLAGDSEDPAFPQGRPRPDAKSFALNSAVHWPAKSTGDWSTGIFDPLIG